MNRRGRLALIGLAWITIPWVWGVAAQQQRLRAKRGGPDDRT